MVAGENKISGKKTLKSQNIVRLFLLLCILILVNVISGFVFTRFDLTAEKRFTLSESTKNLVKNLKDVVYIKVYLSGDFPPAFKRLENSTREMLDELRAYSNGNLEYEFINPSENPDQKERAKLYQQLASKGIQPTNLQSSEKGASSEQIIFPGAVVNYLSQEMSMMLLQDQVGVSPEQMLNNSIQGLEYGFANVIRKITSRVPQRIGFVEGHGELEAGQVADITRELKTFYMVDRVRIEEKLNSLDGYKAIIIAQPDSVFTEKDKFIIDQFIMKGGKVLWLVEGSSVSMDSLQSSAETTALSNSINMEDMLFRYGARINNDLILDLQAAPIPVVTGYVGNRPQQTLLPWYFFPVVVPQSSHPIVKNMNALKFDFVSSIDTVGSREIKKTALLTTSKYSKVLLTPARVDLKILREEPDPVEYNKPGRIVGVLLEGNFDSNFKNRLTRQIAENNEIAFREKSDTNKMIIVSDGDIIRNGIRQSTGEIIPLGFDRYTGQTYGNKNFILNCIDYLCDDSGLMSVRSKELRLRLLDKNKVEAERTFWQVINTAGPLLIVILLGIFRYYRRKVKFAS